MSNYILCVKRSYMFKCFVVWERFKSVLNAVENFDHSFDINLWIKNMFFWKYDSFNWQTNLKVFWQRSNLLKFWWEPCRKKDESLILKRSLEYKLTTIFSPEFVWFMGRRYDNHFYSGHLFFIWISFQGSKIWKLFHPPKTLQHCDNLVVPSI